jgi:hypothetical protein
MSDRASTKPRPRLLYLDNLRIYLTVLVILHHAALAYSLWFTFLMVGIIVYLLYFFQERYNHAGPLAKSMAANVYTSTSFTKRSSTSFRFSCCQ